MSGGGQIRCHISALNPITECVGQKEQIDNCTECNSKTYHTELWSQATWFEWGSFDPFRCGIMTLIDCLNLSFNLRQKNTWQQNHQELWCLSRPFSSTWLCFPKVSAWKHVKHMERIEAGWNAATCSSFSLTSFKKLYILYPP